MVEIKEVSTRKQRKQFVEFPLRLYKDNEWFVPPLYGDEMNVFKPNYVYYEQAEAVYYLAYRDGEVVGRISGILQRASPDSTPSTTTKWLRRCSTPLRSGADKRVWRK